MNVVIKPAIDQMIWAEPPLAGSTCNKRGTSNTPNLPYDNLPADISKLLPVIVWVAILLFTPGVLSGCSESKTYDELLASAKTYQDKNEPGAAVLELKNALLQRPDSAEARLLLGSIYVKLGDGASAEKELQRAHELGASRESILVPLAKSLLLQAKFRQIIAEIRPLDTLPSTDQAELHAIRGSAYIGDARPAEAIEEFGVAFELAPNLPSAMAGRARLAAIQGNTADARDWIAKALANSPEFAEAWSLLGDMELTAGNATEAEAAFSKSIALRKYLGDNNLDIARRALARIQLEKYREAEADIEQLKQAGFNGHPYVTYVEGLNYFTQEKYRKAAEAFEVSYNADQSSVPTQFYLATTYYVLGSLEHANDFANRVLSKAPRSLSANRLLGAIQVSRSEYDAATDSLLKALDSSPDNEMILMMLANAYLLKDDAAQAIGVYDEILLLDPELSQAKKGLMLARLMDGQSVDAGITVDGLELNHAQADDDYTRELFLALEAFRDSNLVLALARARQLQAQYPDKVGPLKLIAACYLGQGLWDDARIELDKLLLLEPREPSALMNLAKLEIATDDLERARTLLKVLLEASPQDGKPALLLADVETQLGGQQAGTQVLEQAVKRIPDSASLRLALADRYLRAGEVTKVLEITQDVTDEQFQGQPGLLGLRGKAQELQGDRTAARSTLQRWAQLAPDSAQAHYRYANSLAQNGDLKEARNELERAVQLDPNYLPARIGEIKMQVHTGEVEGAKETLAKLKSDFGNDPEVLGIEGWYALGTGDYFTAEDSFSTALEAGPSGELTILLHRALWGQQRHDEAIALILDWLEDHPRDTAAQLELANAYLAEDNNEAAGVAYARVLELSPNNALALNNLAWLSGDKDLKQAIEYAKKAYELLPNDPLVLDTYGVLLVKKGEVSRGHRMIQKAADNSPADPTIQLHLGQALIEQKQFAEARTVLDTLVQKAPGTESATEARALLESLPR